MSNLLDLLHEYADKKGVSHLGELLKRSGNDYAFNKFLESDEKVLNLEAVLSPSHIKSLCDLLRANLTNLPF